MIEKFSWLSVNQQIEGALRVQGSVLRKDRAVVSYFSHTVPRTKGKCYGLPGRKLKNTVCVTDIGELSLTLLNGSNRLVARDYFK